MRYPATTMEHGYNRYTHGCRCDVCRTAKAEYIRVQRRERSEMRHIIERAGYICVVSDITHGYSGYQNYHCRCDVCRAAKAEMDKAQPYVYRYREPKHRTRPAAMCPRCNLRRQVRRDGRLAVHFIGGRQQYCPGALEDLFTARATP